MPRRTGLALACRLLPLIMAAACVGAIPVASAQPANAALSVRYDIPAQPLSDALRRFIAASGWEVGYVSELAAGRRSAEVRGEFNAEQALGQLLQGTGLGFEFAGTRSVRIIELPTDGAMRLGPVRVEGADVRSSDSGEASITEDTGSYTTPEMSGATRLPLSLRETPQAATVVTRQRMEDEAMDDITDVIRSTPGMFLGNGDGPGRPLFYSRGFYLSNVSYDGAMSSWSSYIPSSQANLAMYDRVEIVRGATGLMQGAGNPSASVNMVRKRPTDMFRGELDLAAGSWDNYRGTIDVGGPVAAQGRLRARAVASLQDRNSFRDGEAHRNTLYYGIAEADLGDDTLLTLGASNQQDDTDGLWWGGLPIDEYGRHLGLPRSTSLANDWEYLDQEMTQIFGSLEHRFADEWQLKMNVMHNNSTTDGMGTYIRTDFTDGVNYQHLAWRGVREYHNLYLDLSLTGSVQWFGRQHEWVLGGSRNELDLRDRGSGSSYISEYIDPFNWDRHSIDKPDLAISNSSRSVTTQDSIYVTGRLSLADPLTLILGSRLDWYDYDVRDDDGDYEIPHQLTRYAGLVYDLDRHHSLYASFTDIFNPQSRVDVNGRILEPVVGDNYEVGAKGEYFDGLLNASVALFRINQNNRARVVDDVTLCTTASTCYEASGEVRSQGFELEIQGALTPRWELGGGYTYTETEYRKDATYASGTAFDPGVPEQLFKLSTSYRLPLMEDRLRAGGSVYWQSGTHENGTTTTGEAWVNSQGSYLLLNLMASYAASNSLDFQLNVNNVFDRTYYRNLGYNIYWGSVEMFGEPRNLMFSARCRF